MCQQVSLTIINFVKIGFSQYKGLSPALLLCGFILILLVFLIIYVEYASFQRLLAYQVCYGHHRRT